MATLAQVAHAMHTVLTIVADEAAHQTGLVQRQSKLTGAALTQTLVFGWLANPQATLGELAQTAATVGVPISPQGLEQRFTPAAAACLQQVLATAVETLLTADPVAIPVLQRFTGVILQDSTTVPLPPALAEVWPGGSGPAALKLQVRLDLTTGGLTGPLLQPGREQDRRAVVQMLPIPAGALRIADLGYFSLDVLDALTKQDGFWLSRVQAGTVIYDATGQRQDVAIWLAAHGTPTVEEPIQLGGTQRLPCRLLAVRVPPAVAAERRRRLHAEARRRGHAVSQERVALADWTLLVTNAPAHLLALADALVLARARWQIELLFKLWKTHGHLATSRSAKPWRILCEVYAKLLALLVQHWCFLVSCWAYPDRSFPKAAQTIRKYAFYLASVLPWPTQVCQVLELIQRCIAQGCRMNKRKTTPATYQLLLGLADTA